MTTTNSKEVKNCPVCMDHFTPIIRQPITCPFCPHAACRQCTSQYLLSTLNDPHCMGCKREWNRDFIDAQLTKTFRTGPLRKHRRTVLMDRERGRLPAMQIYVEAHSNIEKYNSLLAAQYELRFRNKKARASVQAAVLSEPNIPPQEMASRLTALLEPLRTQKKEIDKKIEEYDKIISEAHRVLTGRETREVRQFIMKCPADGQEPCRGFLSTAWKCGTCQKYFCHECHAEKAGHQDESHVCKEDAKATAAMIRQETKACPKCGIRISKIDGCDQMWCTSCQTTFSWESGQILLNTVVHNPHYYEYLRRVNNGAVPREAGDVPCGGLPNTYQFVSLINNMPTLTLTQKNEFINIHSCLSNIQHVYLNRYPLRQPANVNRDTDIQYLMKKINEEEWGTQLERMETKFERNRELGLIMQTLLHIGSEKLTQIQNTRHDPARLGAMAIRILQEMKEIRDYTNNALLQKGDQMGMVVPQFDINNWNLKSLNRTAMKLALKNQTNTPQPAVLESAPPQRSNIEINYDTEEENEAQEEETIELEMNGERIQLPYRQAIELMQG